ncbi:uncharacterized protein LOC108089522 [Drosophila ficusphila]|uniref:uncharacterized protein LOC108089522 n=1 Tax=Drosophila ficusphila TaxID=30025 RepID=UPI0007E66515|nr:uncharacterized protein LOC108089522 [Drosophila ficusphila]
MSFFRNIRSSLSSSSRAKSSRSSSRDTTPVRSGSRPASVISGVGSLGTTHRRDSTTSSTLQRGDTFILPNSEEETGNASNTSTLEKKSKKSKVFSKFSTFTKRKKTPSPEEVASYEHHPSDTATNTYYKWRSDGADRLQDYDAQSDPFNFLYEQHSNLRTLQSGDSTGVHRQPSIGSNSSGSFDSSTYRKSKTPTHLREQLEQLKTHSNDDLLEDQQREEDEREKYKTVTINSFRKSFRDRLLQQQKETPHNPAWFVEVPAQQSNVKPLERRESKENRPDFLVFDNDNYRPQSRSPLRDRPSRSATRSPVKRNETFRVAQPSVRHLSPSPVTSPAPSIRIEIKNSISPHSPGRFVPVGVAKPMPTTEYYAHRLLANRTGITSPSPSQNHSQNSTQNPRWYRQQNSPTRLNLGHQHHQQNLNLNQQQKGGRTLVHIGSDQGKGSGVNPPTRGRAPTRVQLYGNKPQSRQSQPATYFGGHYNATAKVNPRGTSCSSIGGPTVYLGRREPPRATTTNISTTAHIAAPIPRRNRSPIKMPWR